MQLLFALTLFVGATLLFLIQPMIGKMLLPLAGGTSAVWITCVVFFQAALLGGYFYAHASSSLVGTRRLANKHLLLLLLPLAILAWCAVRTGSPLTPIRSLAPAGQEYPFFNLILLLGALIGLPFFFVSTTAPLLQRWFADTDHPAGRDPYFLYAASNLGSFIGLLIYPLVVERFLTLDQQAWLWSGGFVLWIVLTGVCAVALKKSNPPVAGGVHPIALTPINASDRLRWMMLSAVPSSLMLSVTTFATVDLAPIPLFIVVPLGLYLLTFVIAFGRPLGWLYRLVGLAAPVAILLTVFLLLSDTKLKIWTAIAMHVATFVIIALACHMELARRRPSARQLTEFFLWVSLGGVIGGLFNALIAPLIFDQNYEYLVGLVLAAFLVQPGGAAIERRPGAWLLDLTIPAFVGCGAYLLMRYWNKPINADHWNQSIGESWPIKKLTELLNSTKKFSVSDDAVKSMFCFGTPALVSYLFVERPLRFGLCVAAFVVAVLANQGSEYDRVTTRSFFGVLRVTEEVDDTSDPLSNRYHRLAHGTTLHGLQQVFPPSDEPLTYYHRTGPIGDLFAATPAADSKKPVAFIGLGTGSLASYGKPGQQVTIYEIDPAVRRIAENPKYFTYLSRAKERGVDLNIIMGDARLRLEEAPDHCYSVICVDAFSSDSIPIHLLTREAIQLYFQKLAPDGIVALHVSNRYLSLDRVVGRIAESLDKPAYQWYDNDETSPGKSRSDWIVLVNKPEDLGKLLTLPKLEGEPEPKWTRMQAEPDAPLWTDDFSNILSVFSWGN